MARRVSLAVGVFQSTLSVRRATVSADRGVTECHISIHALRKESDSQRFSPYSVLSISIHALRKESDVIGPLRGPRSFHFNPRSP